MKLLLNTSMNTIYSVYKEQYSELNLQNESYDNYMKGCLSTYIINKGRLYIILNDTYVIGYIFLYDFSEFTGIGSFLINKNYRNFKYGSMVIQMILNDPVYSLDKPYLLSCTKERIPFYTRNGFFFMQETEYEGLYWMTSSEEFKSIDRSELNETGIF